MSEKVLGFMHEDANFYKDDDGLWKYRVVDLRLVPVRLASESVGLKALKEYCKEQESNLWAEKNTCKPFRTRVSLVNVSQLLSWAEKEAKKNE